MPDINQTAQQAQQEIERGIRAALRRAWPEMQVMRQQFAQTQKHVRKELSRGVRRTKGNPV